MRTTLIVRLVLAAAAMSATGMQASEQIAIHDPSLSRPVTLAIKGEALVDVMPILEEQTGAKLRVARSIADQKVTIFVYDKSLGEVMNGLSTLLQCKWVLRKSDGSSVYEFRMDIKEAGKRETSWQEAVDKAWKDVEEVIKERAQSEQNLERLDPPEWITISFAKFLSTIPDILKPLKAGYTLRYDSTSPDPRWRLPEDILNDISSYYYQTEPRKDSESRVVERVALEVSPYISSRTLRISGEGTTFIRHEESEGRRPTLGGFSTYLPTVTVEDKLSDPRSFLPANPPDSEVFEKKITLTESELADVFSIDQQPIPTDYPWPVRNMYINRSDVLALLHRELGIQVISDYYSFTSRYSPRKGTAVEILNALATSSDEKDRPVWGWDGKFVYVRTRCPRSADAAEIPNRILRPWQTFYGEHGYLAIDHLAQMTLLPYEQRANLSLNSRVLGLGDALDRSGLQVTENTTMRFYALLSPQQRSQILAGELSVQTLSLNQQKELSAALAAAELIVNWLDIPTVGMYDREGRRVDQPDTLPTAGPVSVSMSVETGAYRFMYERPMRESPFAPIDATAHGDTLEEAWAAALAKHPQAKKENLAGVRDITYRMHAILYDGIQIDLLPWPLVIRERIPYAKLEDSLK